MEEITAILNDLNEKGGFRYRPGAANVALIKARMAEGYTVEDFQIVHSNMIERWGNDDVMHQYLRPATLYCASKFEGYLNCRVKTKLDDWR